ncbi:MAG: carboxypeptidase M32 [Pseudomonadales bacterium]
MSVHKQTARKETAYEALEARSREITRLKEIQAIASWDEACMMPPGSGAGRGQALSSLTTLIHERLSDPVMGELLNRARGESKPLSAWQSANLANIEKQFVEATAVPADLVRAGRLAALGCEQAWREARAANDWPRIRPLLEEVVNLARQQADALADVMKLSRYDALLETYEPELRVVDVEPVFEDLKTFLPDVLEQVLEKQAEPLPLTGPFPIDDQRRLCERVMRTLGFDFNRGRFDVSHHPFCGGVPDDTRITTRYTEASFFESLMAICHETGHALYQQGLPRDWRTQPVGDALGAAVHESQSLLLELQVCSSRPFLEYLAPIIRAAFGRDDSDPAWSAENLYRHAIRVERGYIRVDADEINYPLHVILRFELERALLDGALTVADLPDAWDAAMQRYLGLSTRGNDANGCMQDVHWYAGLFGYFPTYTLGALGAAQWIATARASMADLDTALARGDLEPLLGWLRSNIHERGRQTTMQPLFEEVTGSKLDATFYKRHIQQRYLG